MQCADGQTVCGKRTASEEELNEQPAKCYRSSSPSSTGVPPEGSRYRSSPSAEPDSGTADALSVGQTSLSPSPQPQTQDSQQAAQGHDSTSPQPSAQPLNQDSPQQAQRHSSAQPLEHRDSVMSEHPCAATDGLPVDPAVEQTGPERDLSAVPSDCKPVLPDQAQATGTAAEGTAGPAGEGTAVDGTAGTAAEGTGGTAGKGVEAPKKEEEFKLTLTGERANRAILKRRKNFRDGARVSQQPT